MNIFSLLTDKYIKKKRNQKKFVSTYYEGINKVWSKIRIYKKGEISHENIHKYLCFQLYCKKDFIQNLMMVQEDGEKFICKNRKSSVILGGNLNVYLSNDSTNLWIHYEQ